MKLSMFRLLITCFSIFAAVFSAKPTIAQDNGSPFQYRLEYAQLPAGISEHSSGNINYIHNDVKVVSDGTISGIIGVGYYTPIDETQRGVIYDHQTGEFIDALALYGLVDNFRVSSFQAITTSGIAVGAARDNDTNELRAFWTDINATTPTLNFLDEDERFPELAGIGEHHAIDVNSQGDILIKLQYAAQAVGPMAFVVNPIVQEGKLIELDFGIAGEINAPEAISDGEFVVGEIGGLTTYRFDYGSVPNVVSTFPELDYAWDINSSGEFCGTFDDYYRRNRFNRWAFRYGSQLDWVSDPIEVNLGSAKALNDDGDVVFTHIDEGTDNGNRTAFGVFYHSTLDQSFELRSLVDDDLFNNFEHIKMKIMNRDPSLASPTPVIAGQIQGDRRIFFLIPEEIEPTPGITITPINGLVTTEANAGQDSFDVVLDTQPTADVTFGISSDNTAEGTVDVSSLTFTSANWNTPQKVTVTGVDDAVEDGDVAYTILTAAATSTDPDYNGLDADDVGVTNLDDEQAPTETYNSTDTPLAVPDNDPDGIDPPSTILVTDDFQITDLTVTLDISHQRPSDLDVYLVGPDNSQVQLFNFSGDSNVPNFNGTSTLGLWTLEVYDTKKKKTGTLDSWSMTVGY